MEKNKDIQHLSSDELLESVNESAAANDTIDRTIFNKDNTRTEDLHLRLSEKYMHYKDLADRCFLNPLHIDKGDNRVFYIRPDNMFLEEPRVQNQYRNEFIRQISTPPAPEPLSLMADDFQRVIQRDISDQSHPNDVRSELCKFFKKRQFMLQHKKHKYLQRFSHFALTSELVDKVSLKFSPNYSKIQFEIENCVKRHQRLEGEDHFVSQELRPKRLEPNGTINPDDENAELLPKASCLRVDDMDVYTRIVSYNEQVSQPSDKFVQRAKWVPLSHRYDVFTQTQQFFQDRRLESLEKQKDFAKECETKANMLIADKKLGQRGQKELVEILAAFPHVKAEKRYAAIREATMATAKSTYELPPMVVWNQIELKVTLKQICDDFSIQGDMEIDNGNGFSYTIITNFPSTFQSSVVKSQFAKYDSMPALLNPQQLGNKDIQGVILRNQKRYGKTQNGENTLLEILEIERQTQKMGINFINSVEQALFGEFNNGQVDNFPAVRLKEAHWLPMICFQPEISKEQKYQAAILSRERTPIDQTCAYMMEILNVNDCANVNLVLEAISQIHHDKLRHGKVKAEFLRFDHADTESYFTEDQKAYLSMFMGSLKVKNEFGLAKTPNENETLPKNSLFDVPQHLLFSNYLMSHLKAKERKVTLLYVLNAFRSVQKQLTLEMRELCTRDRVTGDVQTIKPRDNTKQYKGMKPEESDDEEGGGLGMKEDPSLNQDMNNVIHDEMVDIMKCRFNKRFSATVQSTCPIVPKYHATFGEPVDRQEVSAEQEVLKDIDPKKRQAQSILNRVDKISENKAHKLFIVTDDYGVNVMYDAALHDMLTLEQELIKICSFFINKVEPMQDTDLRNILPTVDRQAMLMEILDLESEFQKSKLELCLAYMECYAHTCDGLEQQRLIQIVVDLMAKRPRINFQANHFRDSYRTECELSRTQTKLMREFINMQMHNEYKINTQIREYLEKTYRLIYDQVDNKWQYYEGEDVPDEKFKREAIAKGTNNQEDLNRAREIQSLKPGMFAAKQNTVDPRQFAEMLGMPFSSLVMLMKEHHERDPLVKQSMHEHVSFIKIQEGYPMFLYDTAVKKQNKIKLTKDSKEIGMLDFYDGLTNVVKIVAACQHACTELQDVHKPDNGFISAATDLITLQFLLAELRAVRAEQNGDQIVQSRDMDVLQDTTILGNSDKMLFYTKELVASAEDPALVQNPFVLTKIDLQTIRDFDFQLFLASHEEKKTGKAQEVRDVPLVQDDSIGAEQKLHDSALDTTESLDIGAMLDKNEFTEDMEGMSDDDDNTDFQRKKNLHEKQKNKLYPRLRGRLQRPNMPSQLEIMCNGVEAMRLRNVLVQAIHQRDVLEEVYKKQMEVMARDGQVNFKDSFNFSSFVTAGQGWINFVDDGPEGALQISTNLSIKEFDPSLTTLLNFSDPEAFKALICPLGLEELRAVVRYELTNLNLLIVASRTNQILLDNAQRKLCEIDLFEKGFAVANPVFNLYEKLSIKSNLVDNKLNKLAATERAACQYMITSQIAKNYYNCLPKKQHLRETVEKAFSQMKRAVRNQGSEEKRAEVLLRQLRTMRVMLSHDFCEEVNSTICLDAIKMQLLHETNVIRRRAYLIPKDHMVHTIHPAERGEYESFYYNHQPEDPDKRGKPAQGAAADKQLFFQPGTRTIKDFWSIPQFQEIMTVGMGIDNFRTGNNLLNLFKYETGDVSGKDPMVLHEFTDNNQKAMISKRLPKFKTLDAREVEEYIRHSGGRIVDYSGSFDYTMCNVYKYLVYFHNLQNLFDLEFFQCKLSAKAHSITGLEQHVLSGLPFWEDDGEADGVEEDEYLNGDSSSERGKNEYSKQVDDVEAPTRNALAMKIVERVAREKKERTQLFRDLDVMKDKFDELAVMMKNQEMNIDLVGAAAFLGEQATLCFNNIILVLMAVIDSQSLTTDAQKELDQLRGTLRHLSHQDDSKVTFSNGFHVNSSITTIHRVSLEENIFKQDYDNFFKATQPVIDEEGLSPPEFTLLKGLYMVDKLNMRSYQKQPTYLGVIAPRDFHALDLNLINVDKNFRKIVQANLNANDMIAKQYALGRINMTEDEMTRPQNANMFPKLFEEKKVFQRQVSKSRQLKRCLMILMNKAMIPNELEEYRKLVGEFNEVTQWKIMTKIDEIAHNRRKKLERDRQKQIMLSKAESSIKGIQQAVQQQSVFGTQNRDNESAMVQFDQVSCEVEVYQREIMNYMILKAQSMIERETFALSRAFEVNGKRLEVLIAPQQQFASTFEVQIDKKNHLDIINKVAPVQRMLTQFKNRCLEIETLTSGSGVVISTKDLNECLKDLCRNVVKFSEVEMRTRCEQMAMLLTQYENMLYAKDMQLLNLEHKLTHAKGELQKIVNTKVFARGNNLIYELDRSTRQLRLMKDNTFMLEKGLKEKIRIYFDKDLDQARMALDEQHKKYAEYKEALNSFVKADIKDDINSIDALMRKRVEKYKVNSGQAKAEQDKAKEEGGKKGKPKLGSSSSKANFKFEQYGMDAEQMVTEMERLRESEKEARDEVLMMQTLLRKQRMMQKLKEVLTQQGHDFKIDNLHQQLTSNSTLWEQLAESEKREKVLQQELNRLQYELATQEKMIERLRDQIKLETRDKQKMAQLGGGKGGAQKLRELEAKAREFEVLGNVDLDKLLRLVEKKEKRITSLESVERGQTATIDHVMKLANAKVKNAQKKGAFETKIKDDAMEKIAALRQKTDLIKGEDETVTTDYWRMKFEEAQRVVAYLNTENQTMSAQMSEIHEVRQLEQMHNERSYSNVYDGSKLSAAQFQNKSATIGSLPLNSYSGNIEKTSEVHLNKYMSKGRVSGIKHSTVDLQTGASSTINNNIEEELSHLPSRTRQSIGLQHHQSKVMHGKASPQPQPLSSVKGQYQTTSHKEFMDMNIREFRLPAVREQEDQPGSQTAFKTRHKSMVSGSLNNQIGQLPKRINVFKPNKNLHPTRTNEYLMVEQQKQQQSYQQLHVTPNKSILGKNFLSQREDSGSIIIPVTEQKGVFKVGYGSPESQQVEPYQFPRNQGVMQTIQQQKSKLKTNQFIQPTQPQVTLNRNAIIGAQMTPVRNSGHGHDMSDNVFSSLAYGQPQGSQNLSNTQTQIAANDYQKNVLKMEQQSSQSGGNRTQMKHGGESDESRHTVVYPMAQNEFANQRDSQADSLLDSQSNIIYPRDSQPGFGPAGVTTFHGGTNDSLNSTKRLSMPVNQQPRMQSDLSQAVSANIEVKMEPRNN